MVRAQGPASLVQMVSAGKDDEATRILCAVAAQLHAPVAKPIPTLVPLEQWFEALWDAAAMLATKCEIAPHLARVVAARNFREKNRTLSCRIRHGWRDVC